MARALEQARSAWDEGEVPVGAVLVQDEQVVSESGNRTIRDSDPAGHAEVVAIRRAAAVLGDWRLSGMTLYSTLEPCALCAGAILLARIPRLVFAASDPKAGMVVSLDNLLQDVRLNHQASVTSGVLADASSELLRGFFGERR